MGINESKLVLISLYDLISPQTERAHYNSSKIYSKDSNNQRISQNHSGDNSRLTLFYEDLQQMYKISHKDLKKFIGMIEERVSEIYMAISRQTLTSMNNEEINAEQSKIIISEDILSLNLNILKVIGRNKNFEYDKETFKELNIFQTHLVGYLKTKYPRGQQTFVSGDLMKLFKEFDRVNDLNYDILKNSNTYFGKADENKIIKGIKVFINKIISECDKKFPEFEKLMQDEAFHLEDKNEKSNMNYKIGRKIPDNVAKYEKLNSGVLQIFSPQIFRVLIKWMQDLEETIQNTSEKISKKQSFKCYVGEKPITNSNGNHEFGKEEEKEHLFVYVNQYEYDKIVDELISRIEDLKPKLEEKNKEFVNQLDEFNQRFLKILSRVHPIQKYVPNKEIESIKYSSFNAKFIEYILTEKLVFAIKELIKVGQSFIRQNTLNLDIIKFRVTDLMRCQVSGTKKEILQIYNNFKRLDEEGKIEIIKIKNRLSTPLNDAMLIFVMKGSWIICEAQLILSEAKGKVDKKSKNTELVNHYFYELERSPYGIMAEIAVLLAYKDSKILYENKICFNQSEVDIEKCKEKHQSSVMEIQEQNTPFICSKCSSFYPKSQNLFRFYRCKECNTEVCSKCILKRNPELQNSFIMRDINRKLQEKLMSLEKSSRQRSGKSKNGDKKMSSKTILDLFCSQRLKFREKFDTNQKKRGTRKVQCSRLMSELSDEYWIDRRDDPRYFLVVNFTRGEAEFKLYSYNPLNKEIENTSDPKQRYEESSYFSYSEYDLLFMLQTNQCNYESSIKDKHYFLFLTQNELQAKMDQIKKLKAQGKINKHENYQIASVQLSYTGTTELVLDYVAIKEKKRDNQFDDEESEEANVDVVEKKEFKYSSLEVLGERLPPMKSARMSIQFDDFGIQTKHLVYFKDLQWRHNIKELKLANNKLEDVSILFDSLNSLQRFYFNDNYVKQLVINKPLPKLEIINGSKNYIASIQGLSNITKIRKLLLQNNNLKEFPQCNDLTVLNVLNLKANYLKDISNILNSEFPELQQLIVSAQLMESSKDENGESVDEELGSEELSVSIQRETEKEQLMAIEYPKLKNFESQLNKNLLVGKQIAFQSQNLQKISLNNCSIDKIVFNKRQCMQNLKYLHLSGNKIQYFSFLSSTQPRYNRLSISDSMNNECQIDNRSVSNHNLIELVLSNNQIQYLPVMKFSSLKRLELQANKITEIRSLWKSKIYELQYLDLGNNPFTTICTMYFPKLTALHLKQMKQLQNVASLFKGPSQLPCLQGVFITNCQKIDFPFDLKLQNNKLTKLKELHFNCVNFTTLKKQGSIFESQTLESLTLDNCIFDDFPVLKLPKITDLILDSVQAQSFKNLEHCSFPQLASFQIKNVTQKRTKLSIPSDGIHENSQNQQIITDLSRFLTCDFNFPKLKDLSLVDSKIGSLKSLGNSKYNELESLYLKNVKTMDKQLPKIKAPNIKSIEIIGISISNIDSFLGNGFSKLTTLYLKSNGIQSIHQKTLSRFTQIKNLSINNNKLKKFSCNKYMNKLVYLDLSFNEINCCPRIKAKNLTDIKWQGNVFTDLNELQNCDLPALEIIQLQKCDLSKSGLPILNMSRLQTLNITESKLTDLSNLSKSYLPSLRSLNLAKNEILGFIPINAPKLEQLNLSENKIINLQFLKQSKFESLSTLILDSNLFSKLSNDLQLAHLKIFHCNYIKLGSLPILEFPEICEVNIQYAQLTDISQFAKGEYKSLKYLNLSYNSITYLPRVEMESLIVVVIDSNQIDDLSDFFESDLPLMELQWLSFENNNIKKVPNIMFKNIKSIYFDGNPLTQFSSLTLSEYPELYGLYLNNIQISKLKLPRLPKLEELEMDETKVEDLNWLISLGHNLPMLSKICMKNCRITKLPNMDQLPSLTELQISGNPITNIEDFLSSQLILSKKFESLDLDVGSDFEMMKQKIENLNPQIKVQLYKSPEEQIEQ